MQEEEKVASFFILFFSHSNSEINFCHNHFPINATCPKVKYIFVFSTRQYTVPDPPGLFDGHVWPMYLKHRREMEDSCLDIGKSSKDASPPHPHYFYFNGVLSLVHRIPGWLEI